jgi:hypothetical protein
MGLCPYSLKPIVYCDPIKLSVALRIATGRPSGSAIARCGSASNDATPRQSRLSEKVSHSRDGVRRPNGRMSNTSWIFLAGRAASSAALAWSCL